MPARDFYVSLNDQDRAKLQALFNRLASMGDIRNREKFKKLGAKAGQNSQHLWEFKSFQLRFIGEFRPGKVFVIGRGLRKKQDDLPRAEIERALRILSEDRARGGTSRTR